MAFDLQPIPDAFVRAPMLILIKQIEADIGIKRRLINEALRLHRDSANYYESCKSFEKILDNQVWQWQKGSNALKSLCLNDDPENLIDLMVIWLKSYSQRLFRRGQIRAMLSCNGGHKIEVFVSDAHFDHKGISPCGRKNGDILEPTDSVVSTIPPCDDFHCACDWVVVHPDLL